MPANVYELLLKAIQYVDLFYKSVANFVCCDPLFSFPYYNLGCISFNGTNWTALNLFLKAIECNAYFADTYVQLGQLLLKKNSSVILNGNEMNARDCFLKAIQLEDNHGVAYYNLALLLSNGAVKNIHGNMWSARDLYIKAIQCVDFCNPAIYNNLAALLNTNEIIEKFNPCC